MYKFGAIKINALSTHAKLNKLFADKCAQPLKEQLVDHPNTRLDHTAVNNQAEADVSLDHRFANFMTDLKNQHGEIAAIQAKIKQEKEELNKLKQTLRYYTHTFALTNYLPQVAKNYLLDLDILGKALKGSDGYSFENRAVENCEEQRIDEVKDNIEQQWKLHKVICPAYKYAANMYLNVLIRLKRLDILEKNLKTKEPRTNRIRSNTI